MLSLVLELELNHVDSSSVSAFVTGMQKMLFFIVVSLGIEKQLGNVFARVF